MEQTLTDESNVKRCQTCGATFPVSYSLDTCRLDGGKLVLTIGDQPAGTVLNGRFQINSLLGSGKSGSVYLATDQELGRTVAIKILNAATSSDQNLSQRFQREARLVSNLSHPHIVTIFDRGTLDSGQPFIVMEYLNGKSLGEIVAAEGRLPLERAAKIIFQICDALHYAHRAGVVHRDLKPDNILIIEGDYAKIVDFGLAKWVDSQDSLSKSGMTFGTPQFMSPEQCRGGTIDQRTDIYCLGLVIYNMLTGNLPFKPRTIFEAMSMHATESPAPFSQTCPDLGISPNIEKAVMRCLAKELEARFSNCAELKTELQDALAAKAIPESAIQPHSTASRALDNKSLLVGALTCGIIFGIIALIRQALSIHHP